MIILHKINRWSALARLGFFISLAVIVLLLWLVLFFSPLAKSISKLTTSDAALSKKHQELRQLVAQKHRFIYQKDLQYVNLDRVLENLAKQSGRIYISDISHSDKKALATNNNLFAVLPNGMGISLSRGIYIEHIQLKLNASYKDFVAYLKAINESNYQIYFSSVSFNMKNYPMAQIALDLFTIEKQ
jgi:Tfp pilus assembly protein PilO